MNADQDRLKSIFLNALEIAVPAEREAYLTAECGDDEALRREVEELLKHHAQADVFLERPVPTIDAPVTEGPGTVIGPYKLLEQIGEGGFGVVFMAEQTQPVRRKVALKVLKPGMDTRQVIARFEAERQALAIMDHPNIAKVLDGGVTSEVRGQKSEVSKQPGGSSLTSDLCPLTSGRPYFVMELVKGVPITEFCDQNHVTPRQRLELFIPVCQAVQHAHQKGIIHRDLKPSNVLVTVHDTTPVPKVIDFGVAKALGQELTDKTLFTGFAQMVGTPLYMSPEQAGQSGLDIDTRSDIYSLGVLLYELLTGTTPFDKERFKQAAYDEIRRIIREEDPPKPSTRLSELGQVGRFSKPSHDTSSLASISALRQTEPAKLTKLVKGELDWIVMKALEKDRNRRYETANGFVQDIQRYLADEPVQAGPPSAAYRLRKFVRRNKTPVMAAALILLSLVVGILATTWQAVRATRERDDKEKARLEAAEQAAVARAVTDFLLKDLLQQADWSKRLPRNDWYPWVFKMPEGGFNFDPTVSELLRRAEKEVAGKFQDQPLTEAAVRQTLADTYLVIGFAGDNPRVPAFVPHAERAAALRLEHLGPDHPDTLTSQFTLVQKFYYQGDHSRGLALLEDILARRIRVLGADHADTIATKIHVAAVREGQGKPDQAERLWKEVLDSNTRTHGADHPESAESKSQLAGFYTRQGNYAQAAALFEEVLAVTARRFDKRHYLYLGARTSLAEIYRVQGKYARAEELLKEQLDAEAARYGQGYNMTTASCIDQLALLYLVQGKEDQAEQLLRETTADSDPAFVKGHLAGLYQTLKKYDQVERLHKDAIDASTARSGANAEATLYYKRQLAEFYKERSLYEPAERLYKEVLHQTKPYYRDQSLSDLARFYDGMHNHAKAEPLRRELVELRKQFDESSAWLYAEALAELGRNLLAQRKWTEAETVLRECLGIREKSDTKSWMVFHAKSLLGDALLGQKKHADAEPLLLEGYKGMKQCAEDPRAAGAPSPEQLREAGQRLVELYEAWGKWEEAEKWRAVIPPPPVSPP